ncbi:MAG: NAD-dependent dehydratase [Acidimicrobiaceae bacterium]|nr:NAD-dependent dehydratase [Acidimicrobiaceae bacterium]
MQITIAGAHGQIARILTTYLRSTGHHVRGLVRSEDQFADIESDGGEPVLLDLEQSSSEEFDDALDGSDVVVFAAGAGPGSGPEHKHTLDRDGAIKTVESAVRVGADRFVIVSSMGADDPPDDDETFSVYLRAKAAADEAVRAADIDAVIVRPGKLTDGPATGAVEMGTSVGRGEITRADVAAVLTEIIDTGHGDGCTFEVIGGTTPIEDAVAAITAR